MQWAERKKTLPYSTQLWYKWLEMKAILSPSRLNKALREITHLSLVSCAMRLESAQSDRAVLKVP